MTFGWGIERDNNGRRCLLLNICTDERWDHGPEHGGHHQVYMTFLLLGLRWPPVFLWLGWLCMDC